MITEFEDFCLWVYVVVDDIWEGLEPLFRRPGPEPECGDAELIAMTLIGECRGWDQETELLANFRERRSLFPAVPSQSRYNRRRRHLSQGFNLVRRAVLALLDLARDRQCAIDSLPVPVVGFHLAPEASREWAINGASFGKVPSKKQTIYGYKLHLLVTLGGVILDFELAPANVTDLEAGEELLSGHADLDAYGDKGYVSRAAKEALAAGNGIGLHCASRRNQKEQTPPEVRRLISGARRVVETVNSQLAEQFGIERNRAHTFAGLCARLYGKLAAHTLCIYLNRLMGEADPLQIKRLAFN
jgi:hypothetical protein